MLNIIFLSILIYASAVDIKRRTVTSGALFSLFIIGLLDVGKASVAGLISSFVFFFIWGLITQSIGGGDIKLIAVCGFVLKGINGILGAAIGMTAAPVILFIYRRIRKEKAVTSYPLVPFLTVGYIILILFEVLF